MKQRLAVLTAWAKQNPVVAAVYAVGVLFIVVLLIVIISLVSHPAGPSEKDLSSLEQEPTIARRVRKLNEIEGETKTPSRRYAEAMASMYEALTRTPALPEDLLTLRRTAAETDDLSNDDFAWALVIDSKLRRGVWPKHPEAPPTDARVAATLRDAITHNPRTDIVLPSDLLLREKWLRFLVDDPKTAPAPLLNEFYKEKDAQENHLLLYQQLAAIGAPAAWLAQRVYDKLGLLPEPIYVLDSDPTIKAPQLERGPENTMPFVGVLDGDQCAIGMTQRALPLLWVRPCKSLEPRRLAKGELFLLGVDVKYDTAGPMHWMPVFVEDTGAVSMGTELASKTDDRVLAQFFVSAPRFVLDGKSFKPFAPNLELVSAQSGTAKLVSFKTTATSKPAQSLMGFAATSSARAAKACPKLDKDRCDPLQGAAEADRCEIAQPSCVELPKGTVIRWAKTTVIHPEPCMKEYGHKSNCKFGASTGVFIDVKQGGDFLPALHAALHEMAPAAD